MEIKTIKNLNLFCLYNADEFMFKIISKKGINAAIMINQLPVRLWVKKENNNNKINPKANIMKHWGLFFRGLLTKTNTKKNNDKTKKLG